MSVRSMAVRDARRVADLSGQLGYPSSEAQILRRFEAVSADPASAVFVVEDEQGRLIGWTHVILRAFMESDPFAEIAGLVVDSEARRQGAGRALVDAAEAWARERGCATLHVRSNIKRPEAHPFYEGVGFVVIKTQHVYEKVLG